MALVHLAIAKRRIGILHGVKTYADKYLGRAVEDVAAGASEEVPEFYGGAAHEVVGYSKGGEGEAEEAHHRHALCH